MNNPNTKRAKSYIKYEDSKIERFYLHNQLVCVARALEGFAITIDLRNDNSVIGIIQHVDGYMNITLEKAVLTNRRGEHILFEIFHIRERNIRYIHIPESENLKELITNGASSESEKVTKTKKATTFKLKRAYLQHMETVASLGKADDPQEGCSK